jgi:dolichyl-phosphate-mannose--protein O-mannosyl transferase
MSHPQPTEPLLPPEPPPPAEVVAPARPSGRALPRLVPYLLPALLVAAVLGGIALRVHHLDQPHRITFDEDHFSKNAARYLQGKPDRNDHPPLGKLLLVPAMATLGDTEVGRRLVPCLFGIGTLFLAGWAARRLFPGVRYAAGAAAAFVALDGFFVAYSRCSLLDGFLAAALLALLALATDLRRTRDVLFAAVLLGLAMSIKWSGVTFVVPLAVGLVLARNWKGAWPLLLAPAIYLAIFALGLWLGGVTPTPAAILAKHQSLAARHLAQHHMRHHAASYWWTWLWMDNPIVFRRDAAGPHRLAILSTMGNPLLWWSSTLAVVGAAGGLAATAIARGRRARAIATDLVPVATSRAAALAEEVAAFFVTHRRAVLLLLAAWAAPLVPWIVTTRDSYIYHYLPSYGAALLLLAGLAAALLGKRPKTATAAILVGIAAVVYFAPMMQAWPISTRAFEDRLWLPRWK